MSSSGRMQADNIDAPQCKMLSFNEGNSTFIKIRVKVNLRGTISRKIYYLNVFTKSPELLLIVL